jgi:POT family proton-dependent oligopeptide transporter
MSSTLFISSTTLNDLEPNTEKWKRALFVLICAMGVELVLMNPSDPENSVTIWCQKPQFCFIALGENFLISTSYEVAFTYSPESLNAVNSGINLLFLAIASFISAGLLELRGSWMPEYDSGNPSSWKDGHFDLYFIMLAVVCLVSGFRSLALNPYFNHNVKRPIDRERQNSAHTVEMAKMSRMAWLSANVPL